VLPKKRNGETGGATRDTGQLAKNIDISKGNGTTCGSKQADNFGIIDVSKGSPTVSIKTIEVKMCSATGKILR
jgi:hypothetical protein